MFSGKLNRIINSIPIAVLMIITIITSFPLLSGLAQINEPCCQYQETLIRTDKPDWLKENSIIKLLGKSFVEIQELLGEPQQEGYSNLDGPHRYLIYQFYESRIRFCSPINLADDIVVSIIIEGEQEILGARAGMHFSEIQNLWGEPDYGPEPGIDNLFIMDYYFGEVTNQTPEIFISFASDGIDNPTLNVFIKWEVFVNESLAGSVQYH